MKFKVGDRVQWFYPDISNDLATVVEVLPQGRVAVAWDDEKAIWGENWPVFSFENIVKDEQFSHAAL